MKITEIDASKDSSPSIRNSKKKASSPSPHNDQEATSSHHKDQESQEDPINFSLLDILRMISGIVILNLLASYFFTGTWTYNYNGKLLQPHFIHFQLLGSKVSLTESELSIYNGTDSTIPIYIAINGSVWDVSSNRLTYAPGGSYSFLSGKDCARALATNCLNHLTYDIRDLSPEETRRLNGWIEWFDDKYFKVGEVIHEEPVGLPMSRKNCQGKGYH